MSAETLCSPPGQSHLCLKTSPLSRLSWDPPPSKPVSRHPLRVLHLRHAPALLPPGARVRPRTLPELFLSASLSLLSPVTSSKALLWSLSSPVKSASPWRRPSQRRGHEFSAGAGPAMDCPSQAPRADAQCPSPRLSPLLCTDLSPDSRGGGHRPRRTPGAREGQTFGGTLSNLARHQDQLNNFQNNKQKPQQHVNGR